MPDCHCVHPNYVPWIYDTFSDCIYTTTDKVAFFFGLSSMAFWFVCQLPQFIKNCRRQSADALSLCFLIEWLGGDVLNFLGSLLTGMLPTQVWLAGWFVVMDVFILGQYIYLYLLNRAKGTPAFVDSDSDEAAAPLARLDDDEGKTAPPVRGVGNAGGGGSVNGKGHSALSAGRRPAAGPYGSAADDDAVAPGRAPAAGATEGASASALRAAGRRRGAADAPTSAGGDDAPAPAALGCGRGRAALLVASVACVAVCAALPATSSSSLLGSGRWLTSRAAFGRSDAASLGSASSGAASRRLEIHSCVSNTKPTAADKELEVAGVVMGWMSSALYLTSRLPQVYKNYSRGSVEGLSWLMFLCAFLGNSSALIGILPRMSGAADWQSEAPFLPGMMGTIVLDFTIMGQWFFYTARATARREKRKELRDAAKRGAGRGSAAGSGGATDGTASSALLLDTPDLIGPNARRGLYDMVVSPPAPRRVPGGRSAEV